MNGFLVFLLLIFIVIAGLLIFILTTLFKSLQFTFTATNLYKKMINRQDLMVKLLIDIRDNTRTAVVDDLEKLDSAAAGGTASGSLYCPSCQKSNGYQDVNGDSFCPNCQKLME